MAARAGPRIIGWGFFPEGTMMSTVTARAQLMGGFAFRATFGSGHAITLDASPPVGHDGGPRPMELLPAALAGCSGMDVIGILRKMRQDVTGYEVRVSAERAEQHPQVLTAVALEHVVRGRGLDPDAVRKAVELSATKYCSVGAMLRAIVDLTESYVVVDEATGVETRGALALAA
jgi:putative redox protein